MAGSIVLPFRSIERNRKNTTDSDQICFGKTTQVLMATSLTIGASSAVFSLIAKKIPTSYIKVNQMGHRSLKRAFCTSLGIGYTGLFSAVLDIYKRNKRKD